jgi:acetyltransferase-like isoleucine patch superfamily enzyme
MKKTDSKLLKEIKNGGGGVLDSIVGRIIQHLVWILQKYKRRQYGRVVSLGDLFIDREEKANILGFGEGSTIYDSSLVIGDVKVGKNTWVGPCTVLDGSGGLTVGDYCTISAGVQIYTHDTVKWTLSGGRAEYEHAPVTIGSCCYVGPSSIISRGVRIGNHCIVGANSFINTDLEDYSVAAGTPCRKIGEVKIDERGCIEIIRNRDL